ncbi:hypothetical protein PISMIDRAFT_12267 [Pisolithus microcarpus 441]|uniref:Uncharacterized protein n=1 Tax=Pisolithus microcarpus 441 TaxID=765257 RepID=A0A0C9ZGC3_9AGAM|nr:hypothetical protein PISMIDRAFT_12267 [Pisolithus microcarpus 441]
MRSCSQFSLELSAEGHVSIGIPFLQTRDVYPVFSSLSLALFQNITIVLHGDQGIQGTGHETEFLKELDDKTTSYAILSHRWGNEHGTRGGSQLNVSVVPQLENVYLHDVNAPAFLTEVDFDKFGRTNGWFEWFSQGLTPQEFTAPMKLEFFNNSWVSTGSRWNLMTTLQDNTRIPKDILSDGQVLRSTGLRKRPCAAHVISWAADWKIERIRC